MFRTGRPRRAVVGIVGALCAALVPAAPVAAETKAPGPPSDARLAAEPARHDLTREQFYFVLPDRFANGDAANDRGGLQGRPARHRVRPRRQGLLPGR